MNKKLNKNSGNTLVEVIVSILVVSILLGMLLTVFVQAKRIDLKLHDEDLYITEIENIYNVFDANPSEFINNYNEKLTYDDVSGKYKIVLNKDHYLLIEYLNDNNKYTINIDLYDEDEKVDKYSGLSRSIIDKEVS